MTAATARRVAPPSRLLLLAEMRSLWEAGAGVAMWPLLQLRAARRRSPSVGIARAGGRRPLYRPLRAFLEGAATTPHGWKMGRNVGPRQGRRGRKDGGTAQLTRESGRKVSLIGWSLGGIYAREIAQALPRRVRRSSRSAARSPAMACDQRLAAVSS